MAKRICSVEGCERLRRKRDWCEMHYYRWRSNGQLNRPTLDDRLWAKVDKRDDGCWAWTGGREKSGYGKIKRGGRTRMAHRYIYERLVGPIPDGLQLDHLCSHPWCVNPAHLEPVTCKENLLRGGTFQARNAAKTHCANGHELSGANVYEPPRRKGQRACRACRQARQRAAYLARTTCRAGHPYPAKPARDSLGRRVCMECRRAQGERNRAS